MSIVVKKQKGETKEDLLSRFRRIFVDEEIVDEVRKRVEFVKKSRRRYEKKKEIEKIRRKENK